MLAVEPDPVARAVAEQRAAEASVPIEIVAAFAEKLPAQDRAFDAAVAVWVLCNVPDPMAALREIGRVPVPRGEFRFYEHWRGQSYPGLHEPLVDEQTFAAPRDKGVAHIAVVLRDDRQRQLTISATRG